MVVQAEKLNFDKGWKR